MSDRTIVLITGANTGIGYETVKALAQTSTPYTLLLGSRTSKGDAAAEKLKEEVPNTSSTVEVVQIDIESDDSIHKLVDHIKSKYGKLDVLVNNAGAQFDSSFEEDAPNFRSIFNRSYDVNVTGTQVLTHAAAPLLIASGSGRLIFVTSGLSSMGRNKDALFPPQAPNPAGGWPKKELRVYLGYRAAKAGLNMLMSTWYWILKEDGVKTWAISPGMLATGLGGVGAEKLKSLGAGKPSAGGELVRDVVEGKRDGDVGKVVLHDGKVQEW